MISSQQSVNNPQVAGGCAGQEQPACVYTAERVPERLQRFIVYQRSEAYQLKPA